MSIMDTLASIQQQISEMDARNRTVQEQEPSRNAVPEVLADERRDNQVPEERERREQESGERVEKDRAEKERLRAERDEKQR
ncbi:hypothetical protein DXG03_006472, partial [Asterophora parasitica]